MTNEPKWIEHDGSAKCPVPAGHDVEVLFKCGDKGRDSVPETWTWKRFEGKSCITHYRDWTAWADGMSKDKPKLLTEAIVRDEYAAAGLDGVIAELRERGLIAEEPEVVEAREIVARSYGNRHYHGTNTLMLVEGPARVDQIARGKGDDFWETKAVLAALRRGREIGLAERPKLTREMVREALRARLGMVVSWDEAEAIAADLTEALQ